jgi:plasmid stabilization system protein ParE
MSSRGDSVRSIGYRAILTPRALKDADEAVSAIARGAPAAAERWISGLDRAVASLSRFPHRCAFALEELRFRIGLRALVYGNYRILFTIEEGPRLVNVLRVWHGARDSITRPELDQKS